jgi:hypothetical protein
MERNIRERIDIIDIFIGVAMQRERRSGIRRKVWLTVGIKLLLSLPVMAEAGQNGGTAITDDTLNAGAAKATDAYAGTSDVFEHSDPMMFAGQPYLVDNTAMIIAPEPATLAILGLGLLMFRRSK